MWPGINWAHYVHRAWTGPNRGPLAYRLKDAVAGERARRTEKAAFQRARLIISNSKRTTQELVKYFDVDPERVHTVYLGSDPGMGSDFTRGARRQPDICCRCPEARSLAVFVGASGI